MLKLSPRTQSLIENIFAATEQEEAARQLVEECGNNLPFCDQTDEYQMERIRFAVLKISHGDMLKLLQAMDLAQRDWRDVLLWAGFANSLTAHAEWAEKLLDKA